ncbi:spermatogenesis-associated protein 2 [Sorex fumeus]|uniref:spermatogenesis-associated protein 2 n=1 Tax=Sorex fumeus TaxID=62283 RepID=UPI0024ACFE5D|nr:spermatogenesis-associated protein 2 [Sorex fumeus]
MGKPSSMDAKYRDDLFRKYVQFHEGRVEPSAGRPRPGSEEQLGAAAAALLSLPQGDPADRFRLLPFYEVVESSLRAVRSSSLRALHCAFGLLETVGTNLFLHPWKKEFRSIKTYTGPFVYGVRAALLEADVRAILGHLGYVPEPGAAYRLAEPAGALQLKTVAFELFLARVECEQLLEIHAQVRDKGYSELDVVSERRSSAEDARGCADALRRRAEGRDHLSASMARVALQKSASERAAKDYYKPRVTKASRSVDAPDGRWEGRKPPLRASLSLRKEPGAAEPGDALRDEVLRPPPSLLALAGAPPRGPDDPRAPAPGSGGLGLLRASYLAAAAAQDDLDLYTDAEPRAAARRQLDSARPAVWLVRGEAHPLCHKRAPEPALAKCPHCGVPACLRCDGPGPPAKPGAFPGKAAAAAQDGPAPGPGPRDKYAAPERERPPPAHAKAKAAAAARCGFCNRPGATHTCTQCSKVSCASCLSAYHYDPCCKSGLHAFLPHHQLDYKAPACAHLVYR